MYEKEEKDETDSQMEWETNSDISQKEAEEYDDLLIADDKELEDMEKQADEMEQQFDLEQSQQI